eukprot:TRINITY_DN10350_c0_g1_i1.p1 TRINITY_DN10350_c0_g1~~TRINITY_DN10350_c0_g1_i1.p1  ORF type:complete len:116 (+),score=21.88 TRINITY_DN10350_c0_g1_i1:52-348(+)
MDKVDIDLELDLYGSIQRAKDLQTLKRCWFNELSSPEILPYPTELLETFLKRLDEQQMFIDKRNNAEIQLEVFLLQMEIERIKYILQSYFRTRLAKVY